MTELDKLEEYLKARGVKYERIDKPAQTIDGVVASHDRHQIGVHPEDGSGFWEWDAICHFGSYGYERGLLEICGRIVEGDDPVEGWLTAQDVIDRLERTYPELRVKMTSPEVQFAELYKKFVTE